VPYQDHETHLTWHYRNTDIEFGAYQARELQIHLVPLFKRLVSPVLSRMPSAFALR
jgi:trehalose-6-phosphatase